MTLRFCCDILLLIIFKVKPKGFGGDFMLVKAYAKINISLDVTGKRDDGYHLLEMIMQNIDLYDVLNFNKAKVGINISCNKSYIPTNEKNLVYRACKLFMDIYNINEGVDIYIKKNIPVAAGLAGGSADAAATLVAINRLFEVNATTKELMEIGLKIGADVPYCIVGGTALCEGIGEVITPLKPFKNHFLIVLKPAFGVSTKDVYENLDVSKIYRHPNTEELIKAINNDDVKFISDNMKNVLENVTLRKYPVLRTIKKEICEAGALGAMMSGSGPTIFAFFEDMLKAQRCYDKMKLNYKEVYITRTI
jgi:4-diphosphocytidyl-2-C-methyl-D-erythritol kinase